ncbi:hypothetical protein L7F22_044831 [Adiantum nelumboides]|nr:hypothetical protein [Adiantum nelumboides]
MWIGQSYAFDRAHHIDNKLARQGVRQFKIDLLHKLERDDEVTLSKRKAKSNSQEMQHYYQECYKKYVKTLESNMGLDYKGGTATTIATRESPLNKRDAKSPLAAKTVDFWGLYFKKKKKTKLFMGEMRGQCIQVLSPPYSIVALAGPFVAVSPLAWWWPLLL